MHQLKQLPPSTRNLCQIPEEDVWLANFTSAATRETYSKAVQQFIRFHGLDSLDKLRTITKSHIIAWREAMQRAGASNRTINNRISAMSSLFNHLCEVHLADNNPTRGLKRPKVDQKQVETAAFSTAQVSAILTMPDLSTPMGIRDSAILHVLFYSGCRVGAVHKLRVGDFFEDSGYCVLDLREKGGKRKRLAIHQELQVALRRYLRSYRYATEKDAPLFIGMNQRQKRPLTVRRIEDILQKYVRLAGIDGHYTPHSARATFITEALSNNCPIEAVKESVGHADISTTQMYDKRVFTHRQSASFKVSYE